jgi:FKBP-type peptidyl-prolyl cis-trans isomerase FkpA
MKEWVIGGVISVLVLGGIGGFLVYKNSQKEETSKVAQSVAIDTSDTSLQAVNDVNGTGGGLTTTEQKQAPSTASSTSPDILGQYEKYKNEKNALFTDVQVGSGETVAAGMNVIITYTGWLTDGTKFDGSKKNEEGKLEALQFVVGQGQVIPGMEQGIIGMKVGGSRRIIVPPVVGYGAETKGVIPANSVLIFDVVLHKSEQPKTQGVQVGL